MHVGKWCLYSQIHGIGRTSTGVQHSLSYAELQERYAHMPASAIADMLHLALVRKRDAGMPGVTSILHPGELRAKRELHYAST